MNIKVFTHISYNDPRGCLLPLELYSLPFEPRRVFFITAAPRDALRGCHGHYHTRQYYICLQGCIEVYACQGGDNTTTVLHPGNAMLIEPMIWTSEKFLTGNDVMAVICSNNYDPNDYYTDKK